MFIEADCGKLQYEGRIDFHEGKKPVMVYPCSSVKIRFFGKYLAVVMRNIRNYWDNYMGYFLDGQQNKVLLDNSLEEVRYVLLDEDEEKEHELLLFKRQDACHHVEIQGFYLNDGAVLLNCPQKPSRRMEVYGDSVSAGEVSEAVQYAGKPDPEGHNGAFSNSWYSYAWILARKLNAQIHDIAQGGIALRNGTGWFHEPEYIGMEQIYDKIGYQKELGAINTWNFQTYSPHVVIVALGQNDSHPVDIMKQDVNGAEAGKWKEQYQQFVKTLRTHYPNAHIILATTILEHDAAWDESIEECQKVLGDAKVHHFLYQKNGCGTPGHIRIPEAEQMAEELYRYIESLGEEIWND